MRSGKLVIHIGTAPPLEDSFSHTLGTCVSEVGQCQNVSPSWDRAGAVINARNRKMRNSKDMHVGAAPPIENMLFHTPRTCLLDVGQCQWVSPSHNKSRLKETTATETTGTDLPEPTELKFTLHSAGNVKCLVQDAGDRYDALMAAHDLHLYDMHLSRFELD